MYAVNESVTQVLAVRHGQTDWNAEKRIQGGSDIPLNAQGRTQAVCLAEALRDCSLDAIYSSDLQRAWDTAQAIAQGRALPMCPEPGLRERVFGVFEGKTFAQVTESRPQEAERWRHKDPTFAPAGGESLQEFSQRVLNTCTKILTRHAGQRVLLVAHGGVMDMLYRAATRQPLNAVRTWELRNCAINRLLYSAQGFFLVGWNDDSHLNLPL